jgi:hypothetical protein
MAAGAGVFALTSGASVTDELTIGVSDAGADGTANGVIGLWNGPQTLVCPFALVGDGGSGLLSSGSTALRRLLVLATNSGEFAMEKWVAVELVASTGASLPGITVRVCG